MTNEPTNSLEERARHYATGDEVYRKRKKRKSSKKKRVERTIAIVVGVLVAICLGVGLSLFAVNNYMNGMIRDANKNVTTTGDLSSNDGIITYKGHKYKINENIVSLLVIGHDNESANSSQKLDQADMISVVAVDTQTGKVDIIGIPRNSMVTVDQYGMDANGNRTTYAGQSTQQLCLAYGYGKGQDSIDNVKTSVERLLYGIPMTYYFDLDQKGIAALNDCLGGVSLVALETIPDTSIVEGQSTVLMGDNATKYVRYRDTGVAGSSLMRQERQSQYIKAFVNTAFDNAVGSVGVFVDLYNTADDYVTTNMDTPAVIYLAQCALGNGVSVSNMTTLTGTLDTSGTYEAFYLDDSNVQDVVVNTYFTKID